MIVGYRDNAYQAQPIVPARRRWRFRFRWSHANRLFALVHFAEGAWIATTGSTACLFNLVMVLYFEILARRSKRREMKADLELAEREARRMGLLA